MTATAKFEVGDVVRAKEYGYVTSGHSLSAGDQVVVSSVDISGRYAIYTGVLRNTRYASQSNAQIKFAGGKFEKVGHETPPAPPKPFKDLTKEELAKRVVEVSKAYTRRHGWCDEVNRALKEIGLDDFITVTKTVQIEVEVPASATEDAIRELAGSKIATARVV